MPTWWSVVFAGYLPWILFSMWKPEPGLRFISTAPFVVRRTEPVVDLPTTPSARAAILLRRVAIVVVAGSFMVYLAQELAQAI